MCREILLKFQMKSVTLIVCHRDMIKLLIMPYQYIPPTFPNQSSIVLKTVLTPDGFEAIMQPMIDRRLKVPKFSHLVRSRISIDIKTWLPPEIFSEFVQIWNNSISRLPTSNPAADLYLTKGRIPQWRVTFGWLPLKRGIDSTLKGKPIPFGIMSGIME